MKGECREEKELEKSETKDKITLFLLIRVRAFVYFHRRLSAFVHLILSVCLVYTDVVHLIENGNTEDE